MPTTPLLPLPDGLEIITIRVTEQEVSIRVVSNRLSCACPRCSKPSGAIHSYYRRKPLELPCAGQVVHLDLLVKKFFCQEKECSQKIFAERLPDFLEPSSRLTARLRTIVQAIVGAFNAQAGARLGAQLGIHLSRTSFLRSLHLPPVLLPHTKHARSEGRYGPSPPPPTSTTDSYPATLQTLVITFGFVEASYYEYLIRQIPYQEQEKKGDYR